jgi:hypothetical protein
MKARLSARAKTGFGAESQEGGFDGAACLVQALLNGAFRGSAGAYRF